VVSKKRIRTAILPAALIAIAAAAWQLATPGATGPVSAASAAPAAAAQTAPAVSAPIVLAQATAPARQFTLGKEYERLSPTQPTSSGPDKIEVAEVFWYGCPHCYTFDPYLESWKKDLPDDVSFVRIPALWNPLLQTHARIYYTAEALNKLDEMHSATFREIHVNRNGLDNPAVIRDFFGQFGVDAATFVCRLHESSARRRARTPLPGFERSDGHRERQVHDRRHQSRQLSEAPRGHQRADRDRARRRVRQHRISARHRRAGPRAPFRTDRALPGDRRGLRGSGPPQPEKSAVPRPPRRRKSHAPASDSSADRARGETG
jgi:thiol-disulfide isomerase/thioredoxin